MMSAIQAFRIEVVCVVLFLGVHLCYEQVSEGVVG